MCVYICICMYVYIYIYIYIYICAPPPDLRRHGAGDCRGLTAGGNQRVVVDYGVRLLQAYRVYIVFFLASRNNTLLSVLYQKITVSHFRKIIRIPAHIHPPLIHQTLEELVRFGPVRLVPVRSPSASVRFQSGGSVSAWSGSGSVVPTGSVLHWCILNTINEYQCL